MKRLFPPHVRAVVEALSSIFKEYFENVIYLDTSSAVKRTSTPSGIL